VTAFEEKVVKSYYNLKGYFTIENLIFPAKEKRKGGKGRGEIDLVAVKIDENGKVIDAVHVEVTASIDAKFPFLSKKKHADEINKLLKKFFISDADDKLKELYNGKYEYQFVTSVFRDDVEKILREELTRRGANVIHIKKENGSILIKLQYQGKTKEIKITPFAEILTQLMNEMKGRTEHFPNVTLRAIQWFNLLEKYKEMIKSGKFSK